MMLSICLPSAFAQENDAKIVQDVINGKVVNVNDGQFISIRPSVSVNQNYSQNAYTTDGLTPNYQEVYDIKNVETVIYEDGTYETSCLVTAGLVNPSGIVPLDSQTSETSKSAITGTLTLTYLVNADKQEIKITKVSGSWSQSYSDVGISIKDRQVEVFDGAMYNTQHKIYTPTTNKFDYLTGFNYVLFYPTLIDAGTGPRAFSDCEFNITSMGYSWTHFTVSVNIDLLSYYP